MAIESSECGKGLCYCLGLFLAHAERLEWDKAIYKAAGIERNNAPEMWFYGATDHLQELQVDAAPPAIRGRLKAFSEKCFAWRLRWRPELPEATEADVAWAIQEAKDLLREIDAAHGVPTEKGRWE